MSVETKKHNARAFVLAECFFHSIQQALSQGVNPVIFSSHSRHDNHADELPSWWIARDPSAHTSLSHAITAALARQRNGLSAK